jgi:hypothetical protein
VAGMREGDGAHSVQGCTAVRWELEGDTAGLWEGPTQQAARLWWGAKAMLLREVQTAAVARPGFWGGGAGERPGAPAARVVRAPPAPRAGAGAPPKDQEGPAPGQEALLLAVAQCLLPP